MTQSKKMARIAYDALNEKKGEDIKIIDIAEVSTLGDYFVIANGNSLSGGQLLSTTWKKKCIKQDSLFVREKGAHREVGYCLISEM